MKLLIFNGAPDSSPNSISTTITNYLVSILEIKNLEITTYNLSEKKLPLLEIPFQDIPENVKEMTKIFNESDVQIWLSPMYHAGIPGSMKNCIDWLELTSKNPKPYLTGQIIGLICWAEGVQAMQGINNMDAIAKALRAWTTPYSVPIIRKDLLVDNMITDIYKQRFNLLTEVLLENRIK